MNVLLAVAVIGAASAVPTPFCELHEVGDAWNVAATHSFVFVAGGDDGVFVYDKPFDGATAVDSLPALPLVRSSLHIPGRADDVAVHGQYLYVLDAGTGDLRVYDVSRFNQQPVRTPTPLPSDIDPAELQATTWSGLTAGPQGGWMVNGKEAGVDTFAGILAAEPDTLEVQRYAFSLAADDPRRFYEIDHDDRLREGGFAVVITRFGFDLYGLSLFERLSTVAGDFRLHDAMPIDAWQNLSESPSSALAGLLAEGVFADGVYYFTRGSTLAAVGLDDSDNRQTPHPVRPTVHPTPFQRALWYFEEPFTVLALGSGATGELGAAYHVTVENRLALVLGMSQTNEFGRPDDTAIVLADVLGGDDTLIGAQPLAQGTRYYYAADLLEGFAFVTGRLPQAGGFSEPGLQVYDLRALAPPTFTPTPTITPTPTMTPLTPIATSTYTLSPTRMTPEPADLDRDGTVDRDDLEYLLQKWQQR